MIFEKLHVSAEVLLLEGQFQKLSKFRCTQAPHARQSFHFQKIAGTLKLNIFVFLPYIIYIKEQITKNKSVLSIFYFPKMGETVFM